MLDPEVVDMRVDDIARLVAGKVQGDSSREISGVAGLDTAGPADLTFAAGPGELTHAVRSAAGCILIAPDASLAGHTVISVTQPKVAFIRAAAALLPAPSTEAAIHPTAVVMPGASIAAGASLGPHVVVEPGARVGPRSVLKAGVVVGEGVEIGEDCLLHPGVTIYPKARIGNRVILHAGVVIGSDGFGYVFAEGRHHKFPQLGSVIIEDDVEIGANTTIDRGSLGTTVIGEGTKIDNLVQIAHNVRIGRHCVIAAQTGISGSVTVGDFCVIGGQVGIGDHVTIEDGARIASKGGLLPGKIVRKGATLWGIPGRPLDVFKRQYAHLSHLPDLRRRVAELEKRVREQASAPSDPETGR
jgi:UDP-3-O-[3-hydroxymyristoyl] glucosamine N-acyltransferase